MADENLTESLVDGTGDGTNRQPPQGALFAIFAPLLSLISFWLSNASSDWCDFAYRNVDSTTSSKIDMEYSTQVGIWG
eukprot:CAMPEP_0172499346 /NCGR_PEP_ID=MMETSP1066-20121228/126010_1 /TAXON_ID=671091 /ORGANISM="Coscinodiscus wailesii, Strain CCMP2513" /LENGTH=77 /DNA_ID=CAMNT_0013273043 /DNA_START=85 /DNA_END=315 /DNA_ORIENTATION=-